jgi:formylglycine-generating enzyme required for sulfatase activity
MQGRAYGKFYKAISISYILIAFVSLVGRYEMSHQPEPLAVRIERTTSAVSAFKDCQNCPEMVTVPAGEFFRGASSEELVPEIAAAYFFRYLNMTSLKGDAEPQHYVKMERKFAIGRFDVTRGEYDIFVQASGYSASKACTILSGNKYLRKWGASWEHPGFPQSKDDPVVCLSRADAEAYVGWLNQIADPADVWKGLGPYRLPTEDEWEYSARGGTTTARWWGNDVGIDNANCRGCGLNKPEGTRSSYISPANQFGLGDVLGNVWQMVADCKHNGYVEAVPYNAVWIIDGCTKHVMRGGGWSSDDYAARSIARSANSDDDPASTVGFRVVKEIAQ